MARLSALFASLLLLSLGISTAGVQAFGSGPDNGSVGIGDSYFPRDGNGGYDVRHYDLTLDYRPATDRLIGTARITAEATHRLSRFDLDLVGMTVRGVRVDGRPARWSRHGQELRVQPERPIAKGARFRVRIGYSGVPRSLEFAGFLATETGATVEGQPHGAAAWFPANDHPTDAATFTFHVTAPKKLSVIANGRLVGKERHGARTTWTWRTGAPMATYLATIGIGDWVRNSYKRDGIRYADAVQRSLLAAVGTPTDGTRFALSGASNSSYKRLTHEITVPADGATVSFTMSRQLEPDWDYVFVEAHTVGQDDWTTLEDQNGHSSQDTGGSCTVWPDERPFIPAHYQTYDPEEDAPA